MIDVCQIMSKFGDWYETYDEVPNKLRSQITRSMFPPSTEQAAEFGLERWYVEFDVFYIRCFVTS